ncbi:hypothetical protein PBY51_006356 [Eleginops maclovinus]|uniref:Zinc finger and BTB domain-containing protein 25 n=2 Tax=Eleginops maclovinus TaxID=56733 RepID=A0AAN7X0V7_ELEMC|nr:hypothetical protein PBY51_006356 [Eleginops maclovinus]
MEVSSHSLFLLQQLNVQREFGFLCDCTVAIGNVYFKAHRAVLAAFSNYFKMIFIHQSSECIKIQPSDIQPDVFSYLLHIMYTGSCPAQPVDPSRLQDGIKFLHAYQLCRKAGEADAAAAADMVRMSNLYGIQISSQLANKEARVPKTSCSAEDGRGGREGVPLERQDATTRTVCSVASGDDSDISARIKQERVEEEGEDGVEEGGGVLFKQLVLMCPRCGDCCSSPEDLREHLFSHALPPAHRVEELQGGEPDTGVEEGGEAGCLQEALRQSQALANQLAAELRRSRGGESNPAPPARKRKISCAVCSRRFAHRAALQEHMYSHTGRPARLQRCSRLCSQIFPGPTHCCQAGGGASVGAVVHSEDANRDTQDNGSSCYSLDSEVSQESVDGPPVE